MFILFQKDKVMWFLWVQLSLIVTGRGAGWIMDYGFPGF